MNRERAERRERIAVQMMAALCSPHHTFGSWEDQAHDAIAMANALMAELDKAALADTPDADPVPVETHDRGDGWLNSITEAQCEALRRSVDSFFDNVTEARKEYRDYTWNQFQAELNKLRETAKRDRDALCDNNLQIALLNNKLATLTEFAETVRAEAHNNPELYGPFVALVRDLDAKVGAK